MSLSAAAASNAPPLRILVVDDTMTNRQVLAVFLRKLGHSVDLAEHGEQAVERFAEQAYDLVIMDVMMPVMDGYEAARRIKAICGDRWVPVVFLSALDKDENLVAGFDAGGDDYLSKPVNFVVLEAKLRSLVRTIALHRELEETRHRLQAYYDEREAEYRLAKEIFEQLMQRPGLSDPALHYWMAPAGDFSGDFVAAVRAVDGSFYVLLADATGHGLAATMSVLPLLTQFYDSAGAAVPLGRIVRRINNQLHDALPVGRFIAAAFVRLGADGNALWLGGLPSALLVDPRGKVVRSFASDNLPLGIDASAVDLVPVEPLPSDAAGNQLVLFSDGLIEARNAAGEDFGLERLVAALASAPPAQRLAAAKDALFAHLAETLPHDDISLVVIDLPARAGQ